MKLTRSRKLVTCAVVATVGYGLAFAGATGALFATMLSLGVLGELCLWVELYRWWRGAVA